MNISLTNLILKDFFFPKKNHRWICCCYSKGVHSPPTPENFIFKIRGGWLVVVERIKLLSMALYTFLTQQLQGG